MIALRSHLFRISGKLPIWNHSCIPKCYLSIWNNGKISFYRLTSRPTTLRARLKDLFQFRRKIGTDCTPCQPLPPRKMNLFARGWQNYLVFTDANPYKVQAFTAFLFSGLGNLMSQLVVEKRGLDNIDWLSVAKFIAIAVTVSFPILRSWLWVLETVVKPSKFAPLQRMLMDQLLFAPIFLAGFIVLMGFVEGTGWEDAQNRLKNDWVNVMISNYKVWPLAQLLNFYFVPFNQRILFGSFISLFWNTYLAFVVRQGTGGRTEVEEKK